MTGNDYAIVVGINDYADPRMRLKGALNDANDFVAWLRSPDGGRLAPDQVDPFTLLSDASSETPTVAQVWQKIGAMLKLAKDAQGGRLGRRLYIFFAGHGVAHAPDDSGLLTVETQPSIELRPTIPGRGCAHVFGTPRRRSTKSCSVWTAAVRLSGSCPYPTFRSQWERRIPGRNTSSTNYVFATGFGQLTREKRAFGFSVRGVFSRSSSTASAVKLPKGTAG